ncbi:MAG TPA: hypothetical protein VIG06_05080 [Kofleriaceae bacterium]|jgi:hypothetical protein
MNAALHFATLLPRAVRSRLARSDEALRRAFEGDLAALLNRMRKEELVDLARALGTDATGAIGPLRARLWRAGAALEAGGEGELGRPWQPVPAVLGGRLVAMGPPRGLAPPAALLPRPVPPPSSLDPAIDRLDEPDTIEDLLARATLLVGVRLGGRSRDKGEYGARIAALLGVRERGLSEPDWRGEVEVKTVPVVRDPGGLWRVSEDPAVSMADVAPESKLGRVLWVARVADDAGSPILSWYYQEWDPVVAALARRCLHTRPKGPAGTQSRGWYLHKRFFAGSGFLVTLNGAAA